MKIGIATFHRAENFGAMLQAVALRETLSGMGHDVSFVDYWPKRHAELYKVWSPVIIKDQKSLFEKVKTLVRLTLLSPLNARRRRTFGKFFNSYIKGHLVDQSEKLDLVVYGSDQVWARFPFSDYDFDPFYLADNSLLADRHIAYAASMGSIDLSDDQRKRMAELLKRFDAIGVREKDMVPLLGEMGFDAELVCDPTLLLTAEKWNELLPLKRPFKERYALFYDFQYGSFDVESIRRFCESRSLKLVTISAFLRMSSYYSDELGIINPQDFINLVAHADYVFSSSFHGLAFSIIFRRQFYCSFINKASRAKTLLDRFGLSERLINFSDEVDRLALEDIDYASVEERIESYRNHSLEFITNNL